MSTSPAVSLSVDCSLDFTSTDFTSSPSFLKYPSFTARWNDATSVVGMIDTVMEVFPPPLPSWAASLSSEPPSRPQPVTVTTNVSVVAMMERRFPVVRHRCMILSLVAEYVVRQGLSAYVKHVERSLIWADDSIRLAGGIVPPPARRANVRGGGVPEHRLSPICVTQYGKYRPRGHEWTVPELACPLVIGRPRLRSRGTGEDRHRSCWYMGARAE